MRVCFQTRSAGHRSETHGLQRILLVVVTDVAMDFSAQRDGFREGFCGDFLSGFFHS